MHKAEALKVLVSRLLNNYRDAVLGFVYEYLYTGEMYVWINKFVKSKLACLFQEHEVGGKLAPVLHTKHLTLKPISPYM